MVPLREVAEEEGEREEEDVEEGGSIRSLTEQA